MKNALIVLILSLVLFGCAVSTQPTQTVTQQSPPIASPPVTNVTTPLVPEDCQSDLQPQQISDIKVNFGNKLVRTQDGFTIRVLPVDGTGTKVIPAEGSITIGVYSSRADFPKQKEFELYKRTFYVKRESVLGDCGPKAITVLWKDIKASQNWHWVQIPNYGIIEVEYTRTGSEQIYSKIYVGAENNDYVFTAP